DAWRGFLQHVTSGTNNATGKTGTPIDFLAIHTYGGSGAAGSVRFNHPSVDYMLEQQTMLASIRDEFPSLKGMPMFVAEWGGSSTGSKGMDEEPMAEFRNTHYASAFLATLVAKHLALRSSAGDLNIVGLMLCLS